jgi:hypothetical protein
MVMVFREHKKEVVRELLSLTDQEIVALLPICKRGNLLVPERLLDRHPEIIEYFGFVLPKSTRAINL